MPTGRPPYLALLFACAMHTAEAWRTEGSAVPRCFRARRGGASGGVMIDRDERGDLSKTRSNPLYDWFKDLGPIPAKPSLKGEDLAAHIFAPSSIIVGGWLMLQGAAHSWSTVAARVYLDGFHSRLYIEQFSASASSVDEVRFGVSAGLPLLAFVTGCWALWSARDVLLLSGQAEESMASGALAGVGTAPSASGLLHVWLLQVAVRLVPVGDGEEPDAATASLKHLYRRPADSSMDRASASADTCLALLRCSHLWEGVRLEHVTRDGSPTTPEAARRLVSRLSTGEQAKVAPGEHRLRQPRAGSADPPDDGPGMEATYAVVTLITAVQGDLDVPQDVGGLVATRQVVEELSAWLRAGEDSLLAVDDFAILLKDREMLARDQLSIQFPALLPI